MMLNINNLNQINKPKIIWIDKNVKSLEYQEYLKKFDFINDNNNTLEKAQIGLENNNKYNDIIPFDNLLTAINYMKKLRFESTTIIVHENLFVDFVKEFHKNINDFYIIPKIIILTQLKKISNFQREL